MSHVPVETVEEDAADLQFPKGEFPSSKKIYSDKLQPNSFSVSIRVFSIPSKN